MILRKVARLYKRCRLVGVEPCLQTMYPFMPVTHTPGPGPEATATDVTNKL